MSVMNRILTRIRRGERGQASTEMLFILPLFVMLSAGTVFIVYMCWQGVKVQSAANLAARVEGQDRVAGGPSVPLIQAVNGLYQGLGGTFGDQDPTTMVPALPGGLQSLSAALSPQPRISAQQHPPPGRTVYAKFYAYAHSLFGAGERQNLFVPAPVLGVNTDMVKVVRVMTPPKVLTMTLPQVVVAGKAYGGEDPHMFALPRWGVVSDGSVLPNGQNVNGLAYIQYLQQSQQQTSGANP